MRTVIAAAAALLCAAASCQGQVADRKTYLDSVKSQMREVWPNNRTVNIVFHGHSVPAGYARTPLVATLDAYPYQTLKTVKQAYPTAVVNTITTAIGGENSEQGWRRFRNEVLTLRPDVLFIDYGLNDRTIGPEKSEIAWRKMIKAALKRGIKVILCTPTPDMSARMTDPEDPLTVQAEMIRALAAEYHVGLADFYARFCEKLASGERLQDYMSQVNHPNAKGHQIAVEEISGWFIFFGRENP